MTNLALPNQTPDIAPVADSSTKIGRIVAVTGAHAIILLEQDHSLPDDMQKSPEIGTLLKVNTEPSIALALISSLSTPTPGENGENELRIVEVEFIGELPKDANGNPTHFRRGISCYPALGDVVARATRQELAMAYACDGEYSVRIGHIQQDPSIPAMVKTDDLLGKHFAVLGTTGTGKSCSVALIFRRILEANPQAHILLLDVHREYASAFKEYGLVVTPANLNLPFWLLNFEEMAEIIIGNQGNREADTEILRELIPMAKKRYKGQRNGDKPSKLRSRDNNDDGSLGVDTPVPYRISDIIGLLDEALGKLELKGELAPYKRLKARIEQISRDTRYSFMFGGLTIHDSMAEVIGQLFRIPVNGKPITILELGGLPSEIINVVVSVLARMAFDFGLWSGGQVPITFVCEEAHRYVPIDSTTGFEPTKRAISKIAKEGRKYGVSLCIVSQRPAELDPTILSQCNTVFSMRLTNEKDQEILKAGISDAAASLLEFMPTMGAGEAVAFGEGVALPTRIKFDLLPAESLPKSTTASFSKNWSRGVQDPNFLENIVASWRQQTQIEIPEIPADEMFKRPAPAPIPQPVPQPIQQPVAVPVSAPVPDPVADMVNVENMNGSSQAPISIQQPLQPQPQAQMPASPPAQQAHPSTAQMAQQPAPASSPAPAQPTPIQHTAPMQQTSPVQHSMPVQQANMQTRPTTPGVAAAQMNPAQPTASATASAATEAAVQAASQPANMATPGSAGQVAQQSQTQPSAAIPTPPTNGEPSLAELIRQVRG